MPKVTILVAAYNASAYLRCCLDSLLSQTLDDFQAICVDDASTDDTLSILREYHTRDHRIEVIHLSQNQGQAHARNIGLAQARGSYICMLDAD
ncbi:MAG: glycosyltransferase family 2 protein, partial [Bacteroidaceae bacterium]|nr:glycosyltransferase family 2 protein [Bacteroidaceae bacterium]